MLVISNAIHIGAAVTMPMQTRRKLDEMLLYPLPSRNVSLPSVKICIACSLVLVLLSFSIYPWQGAHAQVILRQWGIKGDERKFAVSISFCY